MAKPGLKKGQPSQAYLEGKLQAKDFRSRTPEERREIALKGVEARKRNKAKREMKKTMRETMKDLLTLDISTKEQKEVLKKMGFAEEELNNQTLLMVSLFRSGLKGDIGAIKAIQDMMDDLNMREEKAEQQSVIINIMPKAAKVKVQQEEEQKRNEDDDVWGEQEQEIVDVNPEDWDIDGDMEDWGNDVY